MKKFILSISLTVLSIGLGFAQCPSNCNNALSNVFIGLNAGANNTTGDRNTFVGVDAGNANTTGNRNSFFGRQAGYSNTSGEKNAFFGQAAGFRNTTGSFNVFMGHGAGTRNTSGNRNTFVGHNAGFGNTTGEQNAFFGQGAGVFNTTGSSNSFFGDDAGLNNTTGLNNSFFGQGAGSSTTTGNDNSFFGRNAGNQNTTGFNNVFFGTRTGEANTTGKNNTFFGNSAGRNSTTGNNNVFFGRSAGIANTTGAENVYFGFSAGGKNQTGSGNVFLGNKAGQNELGSNKLYIDNSNTTAPLIYGDFERDVVRVGGSLEVLNTFNRVNVSETGNFGSANGFDFNPNRSLNGIVLEQGNSESSGFYSDGDYAVIWSPGDQGRLVRFYDEDGMFERAYIDNIGRYFQSSDKRHKTNIKSIKSESALEKILKVEGVSYKYQELGLKKEDGKEMESETTLGFIAQDIEKIFPEIVQTNEQGFKAINYSGMIPVLVEAFKEQQKEFQQQQDELLNRIEQLEARLAAQEKPQDKLIEPKLFQSVPNPSDQDTEISFFLPAEVQQATLLIYDWQGKQLKRVDLVERGKASINIQARSLAAGIYHYALIVDGKRSDVKEMMIVD